MERETRIKASLEERFPGLLGQVELRRPRRLWAWVPQEQCMDVLVFLRHEQGFDALSTITGLDEGDHLAVLYHMNLEASVVFTLGIRVPRETPVLQTVTGLFPGAVFYERELVDLLGMQVQGLPPGDRYPLRDDWPEGQYPLRKDWTPDMLGEQVP